MGFDGVECRIAMALYPSLERATAFLLQDAAVRHRWVASYRTLESMGFEPTLIRLGLDKCAGDEERAMEWILGAEERAAREERRASGGDAAVMQPAAPPVTAQYSDEEVRRDLLVHRAVFAGNLVALAEYCKRHLVNGRDHRGRTPLLLAHAIGRDDVMSFLLNRGADPRLKTPRGWSLLQLAAMQGQSNVALDVHLHSLMLKQSEWESSQRPLLESLERMPDFTMEISWEIKSWLPLVGRFAPRDTFQLWKRGSQLRLDSHVRGVNGMQIDRGLVSYLFVNGSVWLVDHTTKSYTDALSEFRHPNFDEMQSHVSWLLQRDSASRSEINTDEVEFREKKTLLRATKTEKVGEWKTRVVQMEGLKFIAIKTAKEDAADASSAGSATAASASSATASKPTNSPLDAATYFDASEMEYYNTRRRKLERLDRKKTRRMHEAFGQLDVSKSSDAAASSSSATPAAAAATAAVHPSDDDSDDDDDDSPVPPPAVLPVDDGIVVKTTSVEATLCLTPDFPLPLSHLLILLDLLSPASSHLAKLRDMLAVQMPLEADGRASFPVRITFPIVSQVQACVTFTNFAQPPPDGIPQDVFVIPKEFTERQR